MSYYTLLLVAFFHLKSLGSISDFTFDFIAFSSCVEFALVNSIILKPKHVFCLEINVVAIVTGKSINLCYFSMLYPEIHGVFLNIYDLSGNVPHNS